VAVLTGLLALWVVTADWWLDPLDTALHEGAHALFGWAHGWRVSQVHIRPRGGVTRFEPGPSTWGADFMVSAAGYASPSIVGVTSAKLITTGDLTAVFILALLAFATLLIVVENRFGVVVVLVSAGVLIGLQQCAPRWLSLWAATFLTWFLLFSGVRSVVILRRSRAYGSRGSDADHLGRLTHLPGSVWVFAFGALSIWCLIAGARLLVR
jgi:Peptidase M50B-like